MPRPENPLPEKGIEAVDIAAESFLRQMIEAEHFSGVVMVARNGQVLHKRAYGPVSEHFKNRVAGRFHVASITKQFTAAAIMQLIETEMVQLDGRINKFLPEPHQSAIWETVSVQHLLSHTSGIPDYAVTRDYYDVIDGWAFGKTMDGMIREAMTLPLDFEPGTQFRYCNLGYTLLGEIIEAQTGLRYANYIKQALLDPMGMENSQIHDERYIPTLDDAIGLRWEDQLGCHVRDDVVSLPVTPADGGLVTTLDDFARWVTVYKFMEHPRLSAASLERMLAQAAPSDTYRWPERNIRGQGFYGLGLMRSGDLIMHEGSIVGFRSFFLYSRDDDLLIAVFSNNTYNDVFHITSGIFGIYGRSTE
ncbi:serine hydrolase domain-containing protein [Nitrospirillum sp. BR 11163]|uniref:serine hydrolase domain-containing protein n=1 Tax=Nitrospirillum sp. BR 11163 TaxID=3104323 RepID=UPI002AFF072C|nr:serine hydrolase domain-containing protein [Nitrospirillum sp. BR 11163]MEA1674663.1 serine hydrolase domain-containing protein [Nitrospirillum sp. BR 11163]